MENKIGKKSAGAVCQFTSVKVVPPAGVVIHDNLRRFVRVEDLINTVTFSPGQRVTEHLPSLVCLVVTCFEESMDV